MEHRLYGLTGLNDYQPNCGSPAQRVGFVSVMIMAAICEQLDDGFSLSSATYPTKPVVTVPPPNTGDDRFAEKEKKLPHSECGKSKTPFQPSMRSGESAELGEFPWTATFGSITTALGTPVWIDYGCIGSLITDQYVLTSIVCLRDKKTKEFFKTIPFKVRLGVILKDPRDATKNHLKDYDVVEFKMNDGLNFKTSIKNIALLKLGDKVKFNDYIRPICLPPAQERKESLRNKNPVIVGWGKLRKEVLQRTLMKARVQVLDMADCMSYYQHRSPKAIFDDRMVCVTNTDLLGPCQGDTGAPLMLPPDVTSTGKWILVGVTLNGGACDLSDLPTLHSNVSAMMGWILDHMDL